MHMCHPMNISSSVLQMAYSASLLSWCLLFFSLDKLIGLFLLDELLSLLHTLSDTSSPWQNRAKETDCECGRDWQGVIAMVCVSTPFYSLWTRSNEHTQRHAPLSSSFLTGGSRTDGENPDKGQQVWRKAEEISDMNISIGWNCSCFCGDFSPPVFVFPYELSPPARIIERCNIHSLSG